MKNFDTSWRHMAERTKDRHPTYEKLLASFRALSNEHLPEDISTEMVLQHSGVSRGSLYHHFEDLGDLLETALVRMFAEMVDQNIGLMSELLEGAVTGADFYRATEKFSTLTQAPERINNRFDRIRLLGFASRNPRMAAKLASEQARLTRSYADLFRAAQAKGWMHDDFDPQAAAILIQAYTLGRIVDDVGTEPMDPAEWNTLIMKIVSRVFGASPD